MGINQPKMMIGKSKFCCLHCETVYPTYTELKKHYKDTHDKARYCCVHCGIYLSVEDFWLDHVKLFHPEEPLRPVPPPVNVDARDVFRCVECDSEFSAQTFLDEHVAGGHVLLKGSSNRAKSFPCQACDKQFRSEDMRDDHFKNCKRRNTECYWCKSKFTSRDVLDKHITDAHPQEPPVPANQDDFSYSHESYKCEICKRSYMSLYTLRLHCFYNHELYKYLQSIKGKYPRLREEPSAVEEQKFNPPPEKSSVTSTKEGIIPPTTVTVPHQQEMDPNTILLTCTVCNTPGHNLHETHKTYDKLMRRYCFPCERLFSRTVVLRQHNEAAHGQAPDAIISNPPPSGRFGKISTLALDNPQDYLECVCQRVFTKEEFHHHHLFFEKDTDIRVCGTCSRKFSNHNAYNNHLHEEHSVPKNMKMSLYHKPSDPVLLEIQPKRQLQEEDYDKLTSTTTMSTSGGELTIFSCKVCLKNFKTQAFIRTHIEEIHKEDAFTRVLCSKCNTTFATKNNLSKHMKYHHSKNLVKYLCPVCNIPVRRIDHLKVHHLKMHPDQVYNRHAVKTVPIEEANEAMNQISCKICSTSFSSEIALKTHMTNKHFPTHFNTFCEHCGLQMNPKSMKDHISNNHSGVKKDKPCAINKTRLSLPEIIDLVQALVDKCGVNNPATKVSKPKNPTGTSPTKVKATATRKSARAKKKRMDLSSEAESEDSNGDEDEFAIHYMYSDSEEEEAEMELNPSDVNDEVEPEPSGNDDEVEPASKRIKITSKKKGSHSTTKINNKSRKKVKTTKTKTKSRVTARTRIAKKKGKKHLYRDNSEDEDVKKFTPWPRRGLRNDPSNCSDHSYSSKIIVIGKRLVVSLERCDKQLTKRNLKQQQAPCLSPRVTKSSQPRTYSRKPRLKPKQEEIQPEEVDIDFVIKDEPMDEDMEMNSVIRHNLENFQHWDYIQLPTGAGDEEQDLPEYDPLS